ncbi:MAG: hypothetical protein U0T36_03290 [Saprospiraceae bacterium]
MSHFFIPCRNTLLPCLCLSVDFENLQRDIEMINRTDADWLHVDIMDGMFVPNISFGADIVKVVKNHSTLPLDVHLMIEKPERYIEAFCQCWC